MSKSRPAEPPKPSGTLKPIPRERRGKPRIMLAEYGDGPLVQKEVTCIDELPDCDQPGRVYWIEVNGTSDEALLEALGARYGLHRLALEDIRHSRQRPKVEPYGNHLFIIVQMLYRDAQQELFFEQVSMFLGKNLLITVQEDPEFDVFNPVRERVRVANSYLRGHGADYLAYALLDAIIDHCFPVLESVGDALEEIEDALLAKPQSHHVASIHEYRRTLMQIRRFVWPGRDVVNALLHDESDLVTKETKVYLRDCYDHTIQIMDLVESYREVSSGLMELYLSAVGMRTNEIMRVLTVMSSIFIPLTFIAGLYGMNFDYAGGDKPLNMPELHWPHGYLGCLLVMISVAVGQLIFFRRKKWL